MLTSRSFNLSRSCLNYERTRTAIVFLYKVVYFYQHLSVFETIDFCLTFIFKICLMLSSVSPIFDHANSFWPLPVCIQYPRRKWNTTSRSPASASLKMDRQACQGYSHFPFTHYVWSLWSGPLLPRSPRPYQQFACLSSISRARLLEYTFCIFKCHRCVPRL